MFAPTQEHLPDWPITAPGDAFTAHGRATGFFFGRAYRDERTYRDMT
jgi:hypothetical protein